MLSPDGSKLAFVSDRGGQAGIWILDQRTRALANVANSPGGDFRPAWSPVVRGRVAYRQPAAR